MIIAFLLPKSGLAGDDVQYWSRYGVKLMDTQYVDYVNYSEFRVMDDVSEIRLWYNSQRLQFDVVPHLKFGLNYTYLESRGRSKKNVLGRFNNQHRFELEANPYFNLTNNLKVLNRNRLEFRWIDNKGSDNTRFRQRWELRYQIQNIPFINYIYTNSEYFFDLSQRDINQNRWIPVGVEIPIMNNLAINLFYMIQSNKNGGDWSSNQIFGTYLSYVF